MGVNYSITQYIDIVCTEVNIYYVVIYYGDNWIRASIFSKCLKLIPRRENNSLFYYDHLELKHVFFSVIFSHKCAYCILITWSYYWCSKRSWYSWIYFIRVGVSFIREYNCSDRQIQWFRVYTREYTSVIYHLSFWLVHVGPSIRGTE